MKTVIILLQAFVLVAASPLLGGIIRKIKNNLRMRKGAGVFQPYFNFFKLLSKEEVVSENASWIFTAAPYVYLSSVLTALLLVPFITPSWSFGFMGDFLAIIFLLSLGRFFLSLSALDTGSAFGGMGSSREMFISSFAEPAAILAIFTVSMRAGSTNIGAIYSAPFFNFSQVLAAAALFIVMIAETSRLPVDNQETHLELTMVHEAMVLEYSGRSLALIELAGHVKQLIFFSLVANILMPPCAIQVDCLSSLASTAALFAAKLLCICAVVGVIEVSIAKMRLFRVVDFLAFAFVLSFVSMLTAIAGF